MNKEQVSIVVPVYNAEEFLDRCIQSLLDQTYTNLQIILVDDGSQDNSLKICEKYASLNSNIEVYHQNNRGVSAARNEGLKHVIGKYLFFVDADDFILPSFIECYMNTGDYPYVAGGYCENPVDGWKLQYSNCIVLMEDYRKNCKEYFDKVPSVHVWGVRYVSKIVLDNNLKFDENSRIGEDIRFNISYYKYIDKMCVIDNCDYVYWIHGQSSIHQFHVDRLREEKEECQLREEVLGESEDFEWIRYIHWYIALEHYYTHSKKGTENAKRARKKLKETIKDSYFSQCKHWCMRNGTLDMKILIPCLQIGSFELYILCIKLIRKIKRKK